MAPRRSPLDNPVPSAWLNVGMAALRDLAASLLTEQRVSELVGARDAARAELAHLDAELAAAERKVSFWDRVAFFHDTPDEARAEELRGRVEAARAALGAAEQAIHAAATATFDACPPIEIAHRVERIIARAVSGEPDVVELDALAERVVALWAPGIDLAAIAKALLDGAQGAMVGRDPHPSLGFHPVDHDELLARSARALASTGYANARAALDREAAEYAAASAQLEQARHAVPLVEMVMAGPRTQAVLWYEAALSKEQQDLIAASESMLHAIERAIASYPPLAIHAAAAAAAASLRAQAWHREPILTADGVLMWMAAGDMRAIYLAALVELRRATEEAFPGLLALVGSRAPDKPDKARGPYRERAADSEAEPEAAPRTMETVLFTEIERRGLRALLSRAVAHGTLLGALDAAHPIGLTERLALWSSNDRERLEERKRWHREMLDGLGLACLELVAAAAESQPRLQLHRLLIAVHVAVMAITTTGGTHSSPITCAVMGKDRALSAIDGLAAHLSQHYGIGGDRDRFVSAVVARLESAAFEPPVVGKLLSYPGIVDAAAVRLRSTPFAAIVARVEQEQRQYAYAAHAAREATARVSFWDQLNIFTDSEAELKRDHYNREIYFLSEAVRADLGQANALLDSALECYPPAAAYFALLRLRASVDAIRGVLQEHTSTTKIGNSYTTRTTYSCALAGVVEARTALRAWTLATLRTFGSSPTVSELLVRWVARELRGP